jgi:hypothetical protein
MEVKILKNGFNTGLEFGCIIYLRAYGCFGFAVKIVQKKAV